MGLLHRRRRKFTRNISSVCLSIKVYWQRLTLRFWRYKRILLATGITVSALTAGAIVHRLYQDKRLPWNVEALSKNGIPSQLGIAVGAAMLGVIGIVFSLSIFSIQQVAERGTSLTLREYRNDWVFAWSTGPSRYSL